MTFSKKELEEIMKENGGGLDLRGTKITALPDDLTVGGGLDLRGTKITALPDNLTVGGSLYLSGTGIIDIAKEKSKVKSLYDGDYKEGRYVYCDGILTHIKKLKKIGKYVYYVGKISNRNVIYDGKYYAHCASFKDGVADLNFKSCKDRGADQYRGLQKESIVSYEDAVTMYRIITGACKAGTEAFLQTLKEKKQKYTVAEIIEKTKGQYGSETFERFFSEA